MGILYEGWHAYAAEAMNKIAAQGDKPLTVEQVWLFYCVPLRSLPLSCLADTLLLLMLCCYWCGR